MEANLAGAMNASRECLRCIRDLPFFHTRAFANYFLGAGHYLRNELEAAESALLKVLDDRSRSQSILCGPRRFHPGVHLPLAGQRSGRHSGVRPNPSPIAGITIMRRSCPLSEAFEAEFALRRGDTPAGASNLQACRFRCSSTAVALLCAATHADQILLAERHGAMV